MGLGRRFVAGFAVVAMIGAAGIIGCHSSSSDSDGVTSDLTASASPNPVTGAFGVDKDPAKKRWDYTVTLTNQLDEAITITSSQGTVSSTSPAYSSSWGPKGWAVGIPAKGTYTYHGETKATADIKNGTEVRRWDGVSKSGKAVSATLTITLH